MKKQENTEKYVVLNKEDWNEIKENLETVPGDTIDVLLERFVLFSIYQ